MKLAAVSIVGADPAGKERAVRKAAMPANLLIPVAASSLEAIVNHIGRSIEPVARTRNGNAFIVKSECGPERNGLKVWTHPKSSVLNSVNQLWVRPKYSGYRKAFRMAFPDDIPNKRVIHHVMNRRYATLHGFEYVRVVAVSRSANSSSGHSENWGVTLTKDGTLRSRRGEAAIAYADLADMMSMLEMPIGGGIMDTVREAAELLENLQY